MKKLLIGLSSFIILLLSGCSSKPPSLHTGIGESLAQLKKACDRNDGKRCVTLGVRYYSGYYTTQDYLKAKEYFDKACKLNVAAGCYNLGKVYMDLHRKNHNSTYHMLGNKYIEKGCTMDVDAPCGKVWTGGYSIRGGVMALPYEKFPNDVVKFKKACGMNDSAACVKVAIIYARGLDVKQDYHQATKYYKKGCDLNHNYACKAYKKLKSKGY